MRLGLALGSAVRRAASWKSRWAASKSPAATSSLPAFVSRCGDCCRCPLRQTPVFLDDLSGPLPLGVVADGDMLSLGAPRGFAAGAAPRVFACSARCPATASRFSPSSPPARPSCLQAARPSRRSAQGQGGEPFLLAFGEGFQFEQTSNPGTVGRRSRFHDGRSSELPPPAARGSSGTGFLPPRPDWGSPGGAIHRPSARRPSTQRRAGSAGR